MEACTQYPGNFTRHQVLVPLCSSEKYSPSCLGAAEAGSSEQATHRQGRAPPAAALSSRTHRRGSVRPSPR